ncbi:MAG: hypothetical protein QXX17_01510 [Conexivisphaerales archaeon]
MAVVSGEAGVYLPLAFKATVVEKIMQKDTEEAIRLLSEAYGLEPPAIKVGYVKGKKKALAVYIPSKRTIFVAKGENLWNPFVILHEFYHHLRSYSGIHRGTEKLADAFAIDFLASYQALKSSLSSDS